MYCHRRIVFNRMFYVLELCKCSLEKQTATYISVRFNPSQTGTSNRNGRVIVSLKSVQTNACARTVIG